VVEPTATANVNEFSSRVREIMARQQVEQGASSLDSLLGVGATSPAPAPLVVAVASAADLPAVSGYSPTAMIDLIIANPDYTHAQYALHFGRTPGWFASVLASETFQLALDSRRGEIPDPAITASMDERFKALAMRSLFVIQAKLDKPDVSDLIVLKAAEIGVKALGLGNAIPVAALPAPAGSIDSLADRLVAALDKQRKNVKTVDVTVTDVTPKA
jgi:hypothetical protein